MKSITQKETFAGSPALVRFLIKTINDKKEDPAYMKRFEAWKQDQEKQIRRTA